MIYLLLAWPFIIPLTILIAFIFLLIIFIRKNKTKTNTPTQIIALRITNILRLVLEVIVLLTVIYLSIMFSSPIGIVIIGMLLAIVAVTDSSSNQTVAKIGFILGLIIMFAGIGITVAQMYNPSLFYEPSGL